MCSNRYTEWCSRYKMQHYRNDLTLTSYLLINWNHACRGRHLPRRPAGRRPRTTPYQPTSKTPIDDNSNQTSKKRESRNSTSARPGDAICSVRRVVVRMAYRDHLRISAPARSSISTWRANREQPGGAAWRIGIIFGYRRRRGEAGKARSRPGVEDKAIWSGDLRQGPAGKDRGWLWNDSEFIEQQQTGDLRNAMNKSKRLGPIKIYMTINRELQGFIKSGLINVNWIEATRQARGLL